VEDWQEQETIFQRVIKPRTWGEAQVKAGKFDAEQFKRSARSGSEDTRLSKWDSDIASQIGLTWDPGDPTYRNSDEYWEVWRPFHPTAQYLVILNRVAIVNVSQHPFWRRQAHIPASECPAGAAFARLTRSSAHSRIARLP
jgi:hypothetical protein